QSRGKVRALSRYLHSEAALLGGLRPPRRVVSSFFPEDTRLCSARGAGQEVLQPPVEGVAHTGNAVARSRYHRAFGPQSAFEHIADEVERRVVRTGDDQTRERRPRQPLQGDAG